MIYLATPYSHWNEMIRIARFREAARLAVILTKARKTAVFSPIAMSHPMAEYGDAPGEWEFWKEFDREFLAASSRLIVACMDGWKESRGVKEEIEMAESMGIPVEYWEPPWTGATWTLDRDPVVRTI